MKQRIYMDTSVFGGYFDPVQFMRQVRDKISADICDLPKDQILEYFKRRTPKERILPARNDGYEG